MVFWGLVLARGSSKSIPDKNIRTLLDKPLITWVLEPMKSCAVFDEIWVSTDDERIASIAFSNDVKVHRRTEESATDSASSLLAVQEFLNSNKGADQICLVQCTSPCLHPEYLKKAYNLMTKENYDSVFSVALSHKLRWSLALSPLNFEPKTRPRRQDWNGEYIESGHFYCFTTKLINEYGLLQGGKCGVIQMPYQMCHEIDGELDWKLAETIVKNFGFNI